MPVDAPVRVAALVISRYHIPALVVLLTVPLVLKYSNC